MKNQSGSSKAALRPLQIIGLFAPVVFPAVNYFVCFRLDAIKQATYQVLPYCLYATIAEPILFGLLLYAALRIALSEREWDAQNRTRALFLYLGAALCLLTVLSGWITNELRIFRNPDVCLRHTHPFALITGTAYASCAIFLSKKRKNGQQGTDGGGPSRTK